MMLGQSVSHAVQCSALLEQLLTQPSDVLTPCNQSVAASRQTDRQRERASTPLASRSTVHTAAATSSH